jgi:hypothetical protein
VLLVWVPAGRGRYKLMAADLVATHSMMDHIGRFLPSVRCSGAAFSFVVDLIINYGSPVLHLVMVSSLLDRKHAHAHMSGAFHLSWPAANV